MGEGVRLSREELHERVRSEPLRTLAERLGVSHPTLRMACKRAEVPTPDRGHWAKVEAGKSVRRPALPPRAPGKDPEVRGGGRLDWHHPWTREELLDPLPPPPAFSKLIEAVRERVAKVIGEVAAPRQVRIWHPTIARLLADDEKPDRPLRHRRRQRAHRGQRLRGRADGPTRCRSSGAWPS